MARCRMASNNTPVLRNRLLLLFCLTAFGGWLNARISPAADADRVSARRPIWADRLVEGIRCVPDSRDREFLLIVLAEAGEVQRAQALVEESLPESERPVATMFIAGAQSARGDVGGALQTLDRLPKGSPLCDSGRARVAMRQAQRGCVAAAQRLMEGIADQRCLDRARGVIAEAQASAGDRASAIATAALIRDEDRRQQARATIAAARRQGFLAFERIRSSFLSGQLRALSCFSDDKPWKTQALLTLAAAYRHDEKAVTQGAETALAQLKALPEGLERATGLAILVVAFSEAGKPARADSAGNEAMKAMSGDPAGVSGLFGRPIVIYALIRSGRYDYIAKILAAAVEYPGSSAEVSAFGNIQAIGAALAAKGEDQRLDKVYEQLHKPIHRAYLAAGALSELSPESSAGSGTRSENPLSADEARQALIRMIELDYQHDRLLQGDLPSLRAKPVKRVGDDVVEIGAWICYLNERRFTGEYISEHRRIFARFTGHFVRDKQGRWKGDIIKQTRND